MDIRLAHRPHLERMIRNAENRQMAKFLEDLAAKLSDPGYRPAGQWNQAGPWGASDLGLLPRWIRLDHYDESRILELVTFEQKLCWWKWKQRSRKGWLTRRTTQERARERKKCRPPSQIQRIVELLRSRNSEWVAREEILALKIPGYSARISEARKKCGLVIESWLEGKDGKIQSWYRLLENFTSPAQGIEEETNADRS